MKFSILIPTTGRVDITKSAIDSILAQKGNFELEIIVTDTSDVPQVSNMVNAYRDSRIFFFKTPNGDPSLGWDFAAKQAKGDYVLWFDDDNYLLPDVLKIVQNVIERTKAEIVTGHHVYYYDEFHPTPFLRNSLKIENPALLDGKLYVLEPKKVAEHLLDSQSALYKKFKVHPGSTFISRQVIECAFARLGHVVVPHMKCNHSASFIVFFLARSAVGIGLPISIVGRLGKSVTQSFHLKQKREKREKPVFVHSPVHGDIYNNHVLESFLVARNELLPDTISVNLNKKQFFVTYARCLTGADFASGESRILWGELMREIKLFPVSDQREIYGKIRSLHRLSYLKQLFNFFGLWNLIAPYVFIKNSFLGTFEYTVFRNLRRMFHPTLSLHDGREIPLVHFGITAINELAECFPRILKLETKIDIQELSKKFIH